jgi:hypothetical protein
MQLSSIRTLRDGPEPFLGPREKRGPVGRCDRKAGIDSRGYHEHPRSCSQENRQLVGRATPTSHAGHSDPCRAMRLANRA